MSGKRSALIVASQDYADPKLSGLRAPAHDASELAQILADDAIGQFDVSVVLDESEAIVRRRIDAFFRHTHRDDLLLLHFSCHGVKDDDGHLYFAMRDTDMAGLDSTAVSADFVERQIRRSPSRRVVLLLDCCYSGAFARGTRARAGDAVDLKERFEGRGRAVITASSSMEYAFEGDELTGAGSPSVFTEALVRGLRTGEADRDEDGLISIDELYEHVYDEVRERTPKQTPRKWSDVEGKLVIARSIRPIVIKPVELPPELHAAIESLLPSVRLGAVEGLTRLLKASNAGLALSARKELEHLCDDDSRSVSARAAEALEEAGPQQPPASPGSGPITMMLPEAPAEAGPREPVPLPESRPTTTILPGEEGGGTISEQPPGVVGDSTSGTGESERRGFVSAYVANVKEDVAGIGSRLRRDIGRTRPRSTLFRVIRVVLGLLLGCILLVAGVSLIVNAPDAALVVLAIAAALLLVRSARRTRRERRVLPAEAAELEEWAGRHGRPAHKKRLTSLRRRRSGSSSEG